MKTIQICKFLVSAIVMTYIFVLPLPADDVCASGDVSDTAVNCIDSESRLLMVHTDAPDFVMANGARAGVNRWDMMKNGTWGANAADVVSGDNVHGRCWRAQDVLQGATKWFSDDGLRSGKLLIRFITADGGVDETVTVGTFANPPNQNNWVQGAYFCDDRYYDNDTVLLTLSENTVYQNGGASDAAIVAESLPDHQWNTHDLMVDITNGRIGYYLNGSFRGEWTFADSVVYGMVLYYQTEQNNGYFLMDNVIAAHIADGDMKSPAFAFLSGTTLTAVAGSGYTEEPALAVKRLSDGMPLQISDVVWQDNQICTACVSGLEDGTEYLLSFDGGESLYGMPSDPVTFVTASSEENGVTSVRYINREGRRNIAGAGELLDPDTVGVEITFKKKASEMDITDAAAAIAFCEDNGNGENVLKTWDASGDALILTVDGVLEENETYVLDIPASVAGKPYVYRVITGAAVPKQENPLIYFEDFENGGHTLSISGDGSAEIAETGHGGKALVAAPGQQGMGLLKRFNENLNDGCILFQFSYLAENSTEDLYLYFFEQKNEKQLENKKMTSFVSGSDGNGNRRESFSPSMESSAYSEQKILTGCGEWNRVVIFVDYNGGCCRYYVNETYIGKSGISTKLNAVGAMMIWLQGEGQRVWLDDIEVRYVTRASALRINQDMVSKELLAYTGNQLDMEFETGKTGNIFAADEQVTVDLHLTEQERKSGSYVANYQVADENGVVVWSSEECFAAAPYETVTRKITPAVTKCGIYRLYATVTDGAAGMSAGFTEFSIANFSQEPVSNHTFGMCVHVGQGRYYERRWEKLVELLKRAGVGLVRDDSYVAFKQEDGTYTVSEEHLQYWKTLADNQIDILLILSCNFGSENCYAEYQQLAHDMAAIMKEIGASAYFEMHNEWNNASYISDDVENTYVPAQIALYEGVKSAYPDAIVVGGNTAAVPLDLFERIFAALGENPYMDMISVHEYLYTDPEDGSYLSNAASLRALLDQYGYTDVAIFESETGYSTADGWFCEEEQAYFLPRVASFRDATQVWERATWYDFQDDGTMQSDREARHGVIRSYLKTYDDPVPYAAKPAYLTLVNYNTLLADAVFVSRLDCGENACLYQYLRSDGQTVLFGFLPDGTATVGIHTGSADADIYDMYGNKQPVPGKDGNLYVQLSDKPVYIVGDFPDVSAFEADISIDKTSCRVAAGSVAEFTLSTGLQDVTVEVVVPDGVYLENLPVVDGGKAVIDFLTDTETTGTRNVMLSVKQGGAVIYFVQLELEILESQYEVSQILFYDEKGNTISAEPAVSDAVASIEVGFAIAPPQDVIDSGYIWGSAGNVPHRKDVYEDSVVFYLSQPLAAGGQYGIVFPDYIGTADYEYRFSIYDASLPELLFYSNFNNLDDFDWTEHVQTLDIGMEEYGGLHGTALVPHPYNRQLLTKKLNGDMGLGSGQVIISFEKYQSAETGMQFYISVFDEAKESYQGGEVDAVENLLLQKHDGVLGLTSGNHFTVEEQLSTAKPGRWVQYDLAVDMETHRFDVYEDHVLLGSGYLAADTIYGLRLECQSQQGTSAVIDNVMVSYAPATAAEFGVDAVGEQGYVDLIFAQAPDRPVSAETIKIRHAFSDAAVDIQNVAEISPNVYRIFSKQIDDGGGYVLQLTEGIQSVFGKNAVGECTVFIPREGGYFELESIRLLTDEGEEFSYQEQYYFENIIGVSVKLSGNIRREDLEGFSFQKDGAAYPFILRCDPSHQSYYLYFDESLAMCCQYRLVLPETVVRAEETTQLYDNRFDFCVLPVLVQDIQFMDDYGNVTDTLVSPAIWAKVSVVKSGDAPLYFLFALYRDGSLIDCCARQLSGSGEETALAMLETDMDFSDGTYQAKAFLWGTDMRPYGCAVILEDAYNS